MGQKYEEGKKMNKLEEKIDALSMIESTDELLDGCIDLLLGLQKDFKKAIQSKDADILLLEMGIESKLEGVKKARDGFKAQLHDKEVIIKYLEGKKECW